MSLASLGWDEQWAAEAERTPAAHAGVLARVSRTDVNVARLQTPDGEVTVPAHDVVVGDWVVTDGQTLKAKQIEFSPRAQTARATGEVEVSDAMGRTDPFVRRELPKMELCSIWWN